MIGSTDTIYICFINDVPRQYGQYAEYQCVDQDRYFLVSVKDAEGNVKWDNVRPANNITSDLSGVAFYLLDSSGEKLNFKPLIKTVVSEQEYNELGIVWDYDSLTPISRDN